MLDLKNDARLIVNGALKCSLPDEKIKDVLNKLSLNSGKTYIIAIGKAAYHMAEVVADNIKYDQGIIITKYGHLQKPLNNFEMFEAGHPLVDENSILSTNSVLKLTSHLQKEDNVLFLISGGGSALFEKPLISLDLLQEVNDQLLKCGANIKEINSIRKRLSCVKGGKLLKHLYPSKVINIVMSDVIGNDLSMIASGPTYKDSDENNPFEVIDKYHLVFNKEVLALLQEDLPKDIVNPDTYIVGDINCLCDNAKDIASSLNYQTKILKTDESAMAKIAGEIFMKEALSIYHQKHEPTCLIMGGETFVEVKGSGLGGRAQEFVLSAARFLKDEDILLLALGSDGSDGPTNAAGGYIDKEVVKKLKDIEAALDNNDSYHALDSANALIKLKPTGLNINDLMLVLIR